MIKNNPLWFLSIFIFYNCNNKDEITLKYDINIKESQEDCWPFRSATIKVNIKNNSNDSLYLTGVYEDITTAKYIPLHENYGRWSDYIDVKYNLVKDYKERFNASFETRKLAVFLPNIELIDKSDNDDFYRKWYDFLNIYHYSYLLCTPIEKRYNFPTPPNDPKEIDFERNSDILENLDISNFGKEALDKIKYEVLFLAPNEEVNLDYNITPLLLMSDSLTVHFKYNEERENIPFKTLELLKSQAIGNYKRYDKVLESSKIVFP